MIIPLNVRRVCLGLRWRFGVNVNVREGRAASDGFVPGVRMIGESQIGDKHDVRRLASRTALACLHASPTPALLSPSFLSPPLHSSPSSPFTLQRALAIDCTASLVTLRDDKPAARKSPRSTHDATEHSTEHQS